MREHYQTGTDAIQSRQWQNDQAPWLIDLQRTFNFRESQESTVLFTYNSVPKLMEQAQQIYHKQGHVFRLNLEFGIILRNPAAGDYIILGRMPTNHYSKVQSTHKTPKILTD